MALLKSVTCYRLTLTVEVLFADSGAVLAYCAASLLVSADRCSDAEEQSIVMGMVATIV